MLMDIAQARIKTPKTHSHELDIDDVLQSIKQTNRDIEKIFFKSRPMFPKARIVCETRRHHGR